MKLSFGSLVLVTSIPLALLLAGASLGIVIVLFVWMCMLSYAMEEIRSRPFLAAFLIAFFVFLMGREIIVHLGLQGEVIVASDVDDHLHAVLGLGLASLWIGYRVGGRRGSKRSTPLIEPASRIDTPKIVGYRQAARLIILVTWPAAMYGLYLRALQVRERGYTDLYVESGPAEASSPVVGQLALVFIAAFCLYLGSFPERRDARLPVALWLVYVVGSLASGQRGTFIVGTLLILCYALVRDKWTGESRWLTTPMAIGLLAGIPLLIAVLTAVEETRGVGSQYDGGPYQVALSFFYNQGVSSTVITNGYLFQSLIPVQHYLLEFLHSGIPARLLGIPVLQDNSVARAMESGSYTHALAYTVLGDAYLAGRGTGSSYLAEGYQVFGYWGVGIVSAGVGLLLRFIDRVSPGETLKNGVRLLCAQPIFWAPRGSTTGFLSVLMAPSTVLVLIAVSVAGYLYASKVKVGSSLSTAPASRASARSMYRQDS